MKKRNLLAVLFLLSLSALGQNTVVLAPIPEFTSYLQNGKPNAFGCVFAYSSGTSNPLTTYTDSTGNTANQNPVILTSGGNANIWLIAGNSYRLVVKSAGGIQCVSGSTVYTVDGVGGGASVLTTNVASTATPSFTDVAQVQQFNFTLTGNAVSLPLSVVGVTPPGFIIWQITQDGTGGHTFSWPANVIGGAPIGTSANEVTTQMFVWNGTNAVALSCATLGSGPDVSCGAGTFAGDINATGNFNLSGNITAAALTAGAIADSGTLNVQGVTTLLGGLTLGTQTVNHPVVQTICTDGTTTTVNANVTTAQILKTCSLGSGVMNTIGKTFRATTNQDANPVSGSMVHSTRWGFGTTAALGAYIVSASASSGTDINVNGTLTCTTITTGASGTMSCVQIGQTDSSAIGLSPYVTTFTADLTGNLFVGQACIFASASASNTCTSSLFTVELLK